MIYSFEQDRMVTSQEHLSLLAFGWIRLPCLQDLVQVVLKTLLGTQGPSISCTCFDGFNPQLRLATALGS